METNNSDLRPQKKAMKKWAVTIFIIIALGFVGLIISQIFPIAIMSQYFTMRNVVDDNLNKIDNYHGETPEDLYAKLLKALEQKDIDLFVKYVVRENQDEIRGRLEKINQQEGFWEQMMSHVGNTEMNFIEHVSSDYAILKIVDKDNFFVEDMEFVKKIGNNYAFWKVIEF